MILISLLFSGVLDFEGDSFTLTLSTDVGAMACIDIPITDDTNFEDVEFFTVELMADTDSGEIQIGDISEATVIIDDQGRLGVCIE